MRTGRPDLIRDLNRSLVLNLLRERGPLSRAELARASGLSPSTVTDITSLLLVDGFLLEDVAAEGDRSRARILGRPGIGLRVNPAAGVVIGAKVAADTVTFALNDLAGETLALETRGHSSRATVGETVQFLAAAIDDMKANVPHGARLHGIGLGVPGIVDPQSRQVRHSPFLGWGQDDMAGELERLTGIPVHIDNDVNTLTIAEHLFGAGRGQMNFVVVTIGRGIGMGAVVNGLLYRGADGGAGELGHVYVEQADGRECWCGRNACLETIASEPALVRDVLAATSRMVPAEELAESADPEVGRILARAGAHVGRAVGNVVMTFAPQLIVISGEGVRLGPAFLAPLEQGISRAATSGDEAVQVVIEPWGDEAWARGAASLALRELFHPAHLRADLRPVTDLVPASMPARNGSRSASQKRR
ncbi:MAG TPA: ROK family transcriptional regulator [Candidatus Limnocylindria bacterium]|nr:ROK family transcriptional regulator [Candidatus Limnocylindria bacterium]